MTLNQKFGGVFGAIYVVVGIAGFFITSGVGFTATEGRPLIVFEVNPLHNIIHLAIGALLLGGAAAGAATSRLINVLVGVLYLLVGVAGFFLLDTPANIIALNIADNFLHIGTAVIALALGMRKEAPGPRIA